MVTCIWHAKVQLFFLVCYTWSYFSLFEPGTQTGFHERQPLETKTKEPDKNLRMEIAEFQTGLDAAKPPFQPLWNSAVHTENKTEVCLREFWLSGMIDLWEDRGKRSKQM